MTGEQVENLTTDILRYFGVDPAGNRSVVRTMIRNAVSTAHRAQGDHMTIESRSLISAEDYRPIVAIEWNEQHGQLSPNEARDFAERLRRTADAAESDAFVYEFLTQHIGAGSEHAAMVLHLFREFREQRMRKDYRATEEKRIDA
jgi:hypothetical protein